MDNPQYYTQEEIDLLLISAGGRPYKVYTALVSQSGASDPTVVVLENTLGGNVVWTRPSVGVYFATLNGAFLSEKTISFAQVNSLSNVGGGTVGYLTARWDDNSVFLNTHLISAAPVSQDSLLTNALIEIRTYN